MVVNKRIYDVTVACLLSLVTIFPLPSLAGEVSLKKTVDHIIVPTVVDALATAQMLNQHSISFCEQPTEDKFLHVRESFLTADSAWMKSETFLMGPAIDTHVDLSVNFWPARKSTVLKILSGNDDISLMQLSNQGISATGFPVIEYLLFDDSANAQLFVKDTRRCDYLIEATGHLVIQIQQLNQQWRTDAAFYTDFLELENRQSSLTLMVNKMAQLSTSMVKNKLDPALNVGREKVQPYKLRSWRSQSSIAAVTANIEILKTMLVNEAGLIQLVQSNDRRVLLLNDLEKTFERLDKARLDIKEPLFNQIQIDVKPVEQWRTQLVFLDLVIRERLAPELGVALGFNDTDGD